MCTGDTIEITSRVFDFDMKFDCGTGIGVGTTDASGRVRNISIKSRFFNINVSLRSLEIVSG
jgi:hypothetical protein